MPIHSLSVRISCYTCAEPHTLQAASIKPRLYGWRYGGIGVDVTCASCLGQWQMHVNAEYNLQGISARILNRPACPVLLRLQYTAASMAKCYDARTVLRLGMRGTPDGIDVLGCEERRRPLVSAAILSRPEHP